MSESGLPRSEFPEFKELLKSIVKRPGMYVGRSSLRALSNYLDGYDHAWRDLRQGVTPLHEWHRWIELRYLISHPAWHWTRILLHVHGSDQAAIEALPQLYDEFLAQRALLGAEEISAELDRRLIADYGFPCHEPETTNTTVEN